MKSVWMLGLFLFSMNSLAAAPVEYMVEFKQTANLKMAVSFKNRTERIQFVYDTLRKNAQRSQKEIRARLDNLKVPYKSLYINNSIVLKNPSSNTLLWLKSQASVKRVVLNSEIKQKPLPIDLRIPAFVKDQLPSNLEDMNVGRVWNELGAKGNGIVIGGQDSGFAWMHPALKSHYRGNGLALVNHNYNWHSAFASCQSEPCDDSGHGTHTMGSMIGDDGQGNQIGVAPDAKWIGCRNMENGHGTAASYLECFQFMLAPYPIGGNPQTDGKPELAPHIINNSWACTKDEGCRGDEFIGAVKALRAAGIFQIAAIGNEGPGCGSAIDAPGNYYGELLAVGAFSHYDNEVSSFSSRGPSVYNGGMGPDLIAPGSAIRSSVPSGGLGDGLYDYKSGTSMAAPHVAGVVALLWSAKPHLIGKIGETTALLKAASRGMTSTQDCGQFPGAAIPNAVAGAGLLDAYKLISTAP